MTNRHPQGTMTHDEVRSNLRHIILEFAPRLAEAVLGHSDFDHMEQMAQRVDAAANLIHRFEQEVALDPTESAFVLLLRVERKLKEAEPPPVGPSVWDLLRKPVL